MAKALQIGYHGDKGILILLAIAILTSTTIILYIHRHANALLAKIHHQSPLDQ